jgi:hypothetical protein
MIEKKFLTLAEGKLLVDSLNQVTREAMDKMVTANKHAKQTYAAQLSEMVQLVEGEHERALLANYISKHIINL